MNKQDKLIKQYKKEKKKEYKICKRNKRYRRELINKATKAELIVKDFLKEEKISARFQKGIITPRHYILDFYIHRGKKKKICIEIDGGYHKTKEQRDYDLQRDLTLDAYRNIKTYRIKNEQVYDGSYKEIIRSIIKGEITIAYSVPKKMRNHAKKLHDQRKKRRTALYMRNKKKKRMGMEEKIRKIREGKIKPLGIFDRPVQYK